jgi:toxin HigB-1
MRPLRILLRPCTNDPRFNQDRNRKSFLSSFHTPFPEAVKNIPYAATSLRDSNLYKHLFDCYAGSMIRSFRHKGLSRLFKKNDPSGVRADLVNRCRSRLMVLHESENLMDMHIPGFDFHGLQGKPKRYSVHVNGPWCITFEWVGNDVRRVDLVQYH